jgi:hypothetical protein
MALNWPSHRGSKTRARFKEDLMLRIWHLVVPIVRGMNVVRLVPLNDNPVQPMVQLGIHGIELAELDSGKPVIR